MLDSAIAHRLALSTCAVHRMDKPHEELLAGVKKGDLVADPQTKVYGSAFLVRQGLVLTARHVVTLLADEHQKVGHCNNWYVQFSYPAASGELSMTSKRVNGAFALLDPTGKGMLDVGFLSFGPSTRQPDALRRTITLKQTGELPSAMKGIVASDAEQVAGR